LKNLELKAKYEDHRAAKKILKELNASYRGVLIQRDVYFNIPKGRLKLRSINNTSHELIYYNRADVKGKRLSFYFIEKIAHPEKTEKLLTEIQGKLVTVRKRRLLYIFENVRIHLDTVNGLGKFIELEAVIKTKKDAEGAKGKLNMLIRKLNISRSNTIAGSYSGLMLAKKNIL
jgi:predicted adenylyl cyclase CyaB